MVEREAGLPCLGAVQISVCGRSVLIAVSCRYMYVRAAVIVKSHDRILTSRVVVNPGIRE